MLQVCGVTVSRYFSHPDNASGQILTGKVPYHSYSRDVRSLEGRLLRGRMIHVSQIIGGGSFNGVGPLFRIIFQRPSSEEIVVFSV